jgi:hypothetical protein
MPQAHKLRLGDGSVIQLGGADLRSWYERGLINDDTPVQRQGSRTWTRLADVENVRGWRSGTAGRVGRATRSSPAASARRASPSRWPRRLALGLGALLLAAGAAFNSDLWLRPLLDLKRETSAAAPQDAGADAVERHRREALQAAAAELPHLRADTVELVMASSAAGVLDPPEVFRRSYEAAGRGLAALDTAEARELGALNTSLSGALSARERAQLADYIERVRGRRPTSPGEDAAMSRLVRRGVVALSPPRRARLQALFAKAVAAAVAPPAAPQPSGEPAPDATR